MTPNAHTKTDRWGDTYVDLESFAAALAKELGYAHDVREPGRYAVASIDCGDGLSLGFYAQHGAKKGRVEVYASAADRGLVYRQSCGNDKMPSATVDTGRDIAAIARDITRRVIDPGRKAAALVAEKAATIRDNGAKLADLCHSLSREFPGLQATQDKAEDQSARLYFNGGGDGWYMTGTLHPDGHAHFERVQIATPEGARKLFALMSSRGEG